MPRDSPLDDTGAQLLFGPWPSPTNDRPRCRLAVGRSGPGAGLCSADCRLPGRPAAAPLPRRHHQRGRATAIRQARRRGGAPDQPIETQPVGLLASRPAQSVAAPADRLVGVRDRASTWAMTCLLYTSDAADDLLCVDLGGRRIIKKKKK